MNATRWAWPGAVAAATLMAVGTPILAQSAEPPGTLGRSLLGRGFEAAWTRQPEQRAAGIRREASRLALATAQRWTPEPPALELSSKTDRVTRNGGLREYEATVAVPLWLPNERSRSQAAASAESDVLEARLMAARWRIAGEVRESYWAYQRALLDAELSQQRLQSAQQLSADVARRVAAGDLARSDSHQAEAAVAAAESAAAEAGAALSGAGQQWAALTGQPPSAGTEIAAEAVHREVHRGTAHPRVHELLAKADLARRQRELAGAQTRANPEVTVGAIRERGEYGERYSQGLVIGLRIPLGTQAGSQTRIAAASAEQLEAEVQLSLAQERTEAEILAARHKLAALDVAARAAERRARLARESHGFFEKSFRLGESDLPTRLRVELEAAEADRSAARGHLERAAAISQLNQALGALPE